MDQAGKRDKRVQLRKPVQGKGTSGGLKKVWEDQPAIWAAIRNLTGSEKQATSAGGTASVASTEITIAYRDGVTSAWGVLYKGRHFNIRHVNNFMERDERLILTCDTGANDG